MNKAFKIIACIVSIIAILTQGSYASWQDDYPWAIDGVGYCLNNNIMQGMGNGDLNLGGSLTKAQMAKMLDEAFNLNATGEFSSAYTSHWSYSYLNRFQNCIIKKSSFSPDVNVTREEFAASLVLASGLTKGYLRNSDILSDNFPDYTDADEDYKTYLCIAVERGYMYGMDGGIKPKNNLRRAEAAVFIHRVIGIKNGTLTAELGIQKTETPLLGPAQISYEKAQAWARSCGAHERFIEIAPTYWKYGELTGIRPEVLYAQAAKETGFGKYTGKVKPEMNNWAGIKTATATGDETYDHETFATPDDGVRGHFNHMCAYVGLSPIGEPHGRYYNVKSIAWAGSVKTIEGLGGKWCPDLYYGYAIIRRLLNNMLK